jgi:hypothetical protein
LSTKQSHETTFKRNKIKSKLMSIMRAGTNNDDKMKNETDEGGEKTKAEGQGAEQQGG